MRTRLDFSRCPPAAARKRRVFWATQADCSLETVCDHTPAERTCGVAGLRLIDVPECDPLDCHNPCVGDQVVGRTISNDNWVEGLILNILLTDGRREDTECGWLPGRRGGHWSDTFRGDGLTSGSLVRFLDVKCGVTQALVLVEMQVKSDLAKLTQWGVAREIAVKATYAGRNRINIEVSVWGDAPEAIRVGLSTQRLPNGWVWDTQRAAA